MIRPVAVAIVVCVALVACDKDPARSVKIGTSSPAPPAPAESVVAPSAAAPPRSVEAPPPAKSDLAPPGVATARDNAPAVAIGTTPSAQPAPRLKIAAAESGAAGRVPPAPATTASEGSGRKEWRPPGCPVPADNASGSSTLVVEGPCAFRHQGRFACEAMVDDLYISMTRKAARGTTLMVYINVENYHGPGDYKHAQVFMSVQDKNSIYRWSDDAASITVGPDQEYAILPTTRLEAEPLLVDCTGSMDNYQCGGRTEMQQLLATAHVMSGKLQCEPADKNR